MSIPDGAPPKRGWGNKFRNAFRGILIAVREGNSFWAHLTIAAAVILCGWFFEVTRLEWCLLVLCIALVLGAETMNSAIESLAKAIDRSHNEDLGRGLDMASGAVLICAIGTSLVGLAIFVFRLGVYCGWWH